MLSLALPGLTQEHRPTTSAEGVSPFSVQQSPQLFAALCAAHAGGYESGVPESALPMLESAIRREIAKQSGPAVDALREFYRNHELEDPGATLSRYVSFGLVIAPPPKFEFAVEQEEIPPDAAALEGLNPLLSAYYREAQVEQLYARVLPIYERHGRELEGIVSQTALLETGYIRQMLKPSPGHTFTVYTEPLVGSRSNFRIYGGRYALVIDPTRESAKDEIRHAMLHFLLDGMALAHHPPLAGRKQILDLASRAPRLPAEFRGDIEALADECLVKAVELRIQHLPALQSQAALSAAEADGFLLIRPMYSGLEAYEKGEDSLNTYYGQLIQKIDLNAEAKRMASVQFAPADAPLPQPAEARQVIPRRELSELERWLIEGESQLAEKDTRRARVTFQRVLEKYPDVPRAQYGLAVSVIVDGEVDRGRTLLEQVVNELTNPGTATQGTGLGEEPAGAAPKGYGPDPGTLAWAHVWLGRIYEQRGRKEQAGVEYRAALAVTGAPDGACAAAQRGLGVTATKGKSP
jgi:tetratricopeptide (TPR) repeat protein